MMNQISIRIPALLLLFSAFFFSCEKEPLPPQVKTELLLETGLFSVRVAGNVKDVGGEKNTERGICYGTRALPDLSDVVLKDVVSGLGAYRFEIADLEKGKTYYFRAWARNSAGLSFGDVFSFSTADVPAIESAEPFEVTGATVMAGGNITADGGKPVLEAGICFDTLPDPDISDSLRFVSSPGTGSFTIKIIDLRPTQTYYYRAFARNAAGLAYGTVKSFTTTVLYTPGDTMSDQEGTKYPTIVILGKRWMAANLRTAKYRDGSSITNASTNAAWSSQTEGAWSVYDNQNSNNAVYGKLYNWFATVSPKELCPTGWKVPTDTDWENLIAYLGDVNKAGLKMRTTGTSLWNPPNAGADNSSGFSGVPGGNRGDFGAFGFKGAAAFFWTSTQFDATFARFRSLNGDLPTVTDGYDRKKVGMSVRCMEE